MLKHPTRCCSRAAFTRSRFPAKRNWQVSHGVVCVGARRYRARQGFRYFRVRNAGRDSSGYEYLMLAGIELYGIVTT